jgi:hypothetical protein
MAAKYSKSSPWAETTTIAGPYLDRLKIRSIPAEDDDFLYTVEPQYTYRPDLLAHDIYGSSKLWWVFAQRNMDIIKDPVFDMVPGTQIFLPKSSSLRQQLGI